MRAFAPATVILVLAQTACAPQRGAHVYSAVEDRLLSTASCPLANTAAPGWENVRARFGGFSLLFPRHAERQHVQRTGRLVGENWHDDQGLQVYYRIYRDPLERVLDPETSADQIACWERHAGRALHIRAFYSSEGYLPGQYVVGYWRLSASETLVLTAVSESASEFEEMLTVIRSVRFES